MASKSSLIITTEDHLTGTTQQSTITDINPAASNSDLKTFAQMTAALSKDEYVKSARVDRLELDVEKPARPITSFMYTRLVSGTSTNTDVPQDGVINLPTSDIISGKNIQFFIKTPYDGIAPQIIDFDSTSNAKIAQISYAFYSYSSANNAWGLTIATSTLTAEQQALTAGTVSFTLTFAETAQYEGWTKDITINITEEG